MKQPSIKNVYRGCLHCMSVEFDSWMVCVRCVYVDARAGCLSFLDSHVLVDRQFASVVTAFAANGVIYMPCTAIGAEGQSRNRCMIVRSSLAGSCAALSSFRMCHNSNFDYCFTSILRLSVA